jgi:hypothetical protein
MQEKLPREDGIESLYLELLDLPQELRDKIIWSGVETYINECIERRHLLALLALKNTNIFND